MKSRNEFAPSSAVDISGMVAKASPLLCDCGSFDVPSPFERVAISVIGMSSSSIASSAMV
ncbi:MAG: hypothetical protein WAU63_01740 [Methylovirgula sp.]